MVVQILWLSRSYDCPILMYVIFHILWLSRSYGRPHLMVVHILLLSTSYGLTLWLSGSYGYILWYLMVVRWHLMVVHVDGCPVDGCPLTWKRHALSVTYTIHGWTVAGYLCIQVRQITFEKNCGFSDAWKSNFHWFPLLPSWKLFHWVFFSPSAEASSSSSDSSSL